MFMQIYINWKYVVNPWHVVSVFLHSTSLPTKVLVGGVEGSIISENCSDHSIEISFLGQILAFIF